MSDNIEDFEEMEDIVPQQELTPAEDQLEVESEQSELTTTEHQLEVDEEVSVYMQQLNLAQLIIHGKISELSENPVVRFIDDKFAIVDGDKVILTADWHFIGEYHTEKENPNIKGYEFVWSWGLRPDAEEDPHVKEVHRVTEALPYGLQPLTFPLVQFPDVGILELIKAYAFNELELDFTHILYNAELGSYGIFGIYNTEFLGEQKPKMLDKIVALAKKKAGELRKENPELDGSDAIKQAWQSPEILSLVASYQRDKESRESASKEFADFFKKAIMNPDLVLDNPDIVDNGEQVQEIDEKYTNALAAVERALDAVREEELADMQQVGDESDDEA